MRGGLSTVSKKVQGIHSTPLDVRNDATPLDVRNDASYYIYNCAMGFRCGESRRLWDRHAPHRHAPHVCPHSVGNSFPEYTPSHFFSNYFSGHTLSWHLLLPINWS